MTSALMYLLIGLAIFLILYGLSEENKENKDNNKQKEIDNNIKEAFGGLQSLYSNDGIQDIHLTVNNDRGGYDPYRFWRDYPWWLPTRNLDTISYYPFMYEYQFDRYSTLYPYW